MFVEFFKLTGTVVSIFVVMHYYARAAKSTYDLFALSKASVDCLAFLLLWLTVAIIFKLFREGVALLQGKPQDNAGKSGSQWLAFLLALARGVLVCSLIFTGLLISDRKTIVKSARQAVSAVVLQDLTINIYQGTYDGLISKIFPAEEFNDKVLSLKYSGVDKEK